MSALPRPAAHAAALDPDWLRAVATEVHSLCERMFSLGADAEAARGAGDVERLHEALDQRERVMRRIEPLLTPLAVVRSSIARGAVADPQLEQLLNEIGAWLQSILSATEALADSLEGDCAALARELRRTDHAASAEAAYRITESAVPRLDLVR